jgi:hypothetical protein
MGKQGEVLATGFVVKSFRMCRPEEIKREEFAQAPEIANSLEKILPRLTSWGADKDTIQVVTLERI